jgi:hypothetical protein
MAVVPPLNNFLGPEGDTVTVAEQLLNTEYRQWLLHVADTRESGRAWRQARDEKVIAREEGYTYIASAISRSTAHEETRRRHLCYCSNE